MIRSYRVTCANAPDDFLTADGLYFRSRTNGGLDVFAKNGLGMGTYERGDWIAITDVSALNFPEEVQ